MRRLAVLLTLAGSLCMPLQAGRAVDRSVPAQQDAGAPPPLDAPLPLPDGPGKVLVERLCKGCHEAAIVMTARETREGWSTVVADMVAKGTNATPAEREIMIDYLAEHRGRAPRVDPRGQSAYAHSCAECHGPDGRGLSGKGPALVASPLVAGPAADLIRIVLHGSDGPGGRMPAAAPQTSDEDIALIVTYVRRSWGQGASAVTAPMVAEVRTARAPR